MWYLHQFIIYKTKISFTSRERNNIIIFWQFIWITEIIDFKVGIKLHVYHAWYSRSGKLWYMYMQNAYRVLQNNTILKWFWPISIKMEYSQLLTQFVVISFFQTPNCPLQLGALVAQWVKLWLTDLVVMSLNSAWGEDLFNGKQGFHCTQPFIIICPSSWYDWNTVEKDVKSQIIHPSILLLLWKLYCHERWLFSFCMTIVKQFQMMKIMMMMSMMMVTLINIKVKVT